MPALSHGHKRGYVRTRVYVTWVNMKSRCNDVFRPDAINYIGRGISYAASWERFENFLADMGEPGEGLTLDRIDNNRGYSKENCRWATRAVQNLNKRNCVRYEHDGRNLTLSEWSRETGVGRVTMLKRIQRGVPASIAISHKGFLKLPPTELNSDQPRIS